MRRWFAVLIAAMVAQSAQAASVTLDLPGGAASRETVNYACGGEKITATYINAGDNALAVLKIGERVVVTVNVLSGSGARYAGQEIVWWTKGSEATLYDLRKGENDPGEMCKTVS
ncbi:MAG: MliC family protein [Rhizobiaceae bacterium]|nr:MliC family protein [Rhizobiaceae bacterium]